MPGRDIIRSSWLGTAAFVAATIPLAVVEVGQVVAVAVDVLLFVAGSAIFLWALALAAGRSREAEISMAGLLVEAVVAVAAAAARPFTAVAFGILVPTWGLAHGELWAARHGTFGPRQAPPQRSRRSS